MLTAEQYLDFQEGPGRQYWRDSILSLLKMVDLVIVGFSASDPDFKAQLERVKDIASPDHPIFMFATGLDLDEVRDYYRQYNIHIIAYTNEDGTHRGLHRVLARYNPFIAKRDSPFVGLEPVDTSVATLASSIHLFTQLRIAEDGKSCFERACAAVVLQTLSDHGHGQEVSISWLTDMLAQKTFAIAGVDPTAIRSALEYLHSRGFISLSDDGNSVALESSGVSVLKGVAAERALIQEKFETMCRLFLKRQYADLDQDPANAIIKNLTAGLIRAFEKRGMEIARSVFSDDPIDVSDATDVLDILNKASGALDSETERAAFADLMIEVMLKPSEGAKGYLASLSQGYFAYHALGLEPNCSEERLNMARETAWILDSSIILPLLALDCLNHGYAKDLVERMKSLGLRCYTTERLFDEVQDHAWWAIANFGDVPYDSPQLLQAAMAGPGYKHNLFLDGFTKWSATQGRPSLGNYMVQCLGRGYATNLRASLHEQVAALGIEIRSFADWPSFSEEAWAERDAISQEIAALRQRSGTYTGRE